MLRRVPLVDLLRTDRAPGLEGSAEPSAIDLNPPDADDLYLDRLNLCFGGGWTRSMVRWYLRRRFAGRAPDLVVLREKGRIVSGMGVSYRRVRRPGGGLLDVGIATAGWTLPEARG